VCCMASCVSGLRGLGPQRLRPVARSSLRVQGRPFLFLDVVSRFSLAALLSSTVSAGVLVSAPVHRFAHRRDRSGQHARKRALRAANRTLGIDGIAQEQLLADGGAARSAAAARGGAAAWAECAALLVEACGLAEDEDQAADAWLAIAYGWSPWLRAGKPTGSWLENQVVLPEPAELRRDLLWLTSLEASPLAMALAKEGEGASAKAALRQLLQARPGAVLRECFARRGCSS
ncbi:unnamed protein product, partial [Polarella glacialis]